MSVKTCYIVTSGEGKIFQILEVFSVEDLANGFVDKYNKGESVALGGPKAEVKLFYMDRRPDSRLLTTVCMARNGVVVETFIDWILSKTPPGFISWTYESQSLWAIETSNLDIAIEEVNKVRLKILEAGKWGVRDEELLQQLVDQSN